MVRQVGGVQGGEVEFMGLVAVSLEVEESQEETGLFDQRGVAEIG